jgi:hypothetical protein
MPTMKSTSGTAVRASGIPEELRLTPRTDVVPTRNIGVSLHQLWHTECSRTIPPMCSGGRRPLAFCEGDRGMSNKEAEKLPDAGPQDPFADTQSLVAHVVPAGVDRRSFFIRAAVGGAAAVMTGCSPSTEEKTAKATATAAPAAPAPSAAAPPLAADLNVVMKEKGPILTVADEFYKVGPDLRARTRLARCALPTTSTSEPPSCRPTSSPRRRSFR